MHMAVRRTMVLYIYDSVKVHEYTYTSRQYTPDSSWEIDFFEAAPDDEMSHVTTHYNKTNNLFE